MLTFDVCHHLASSISRLTFNFHKKMPDIELKEIDIDNYRRAVLLELKEGQDKFVASNVYSIAQSKFYPSWKPTGIFANDEMVGFLMYGKDEEIDDSIWIIRLMIAARFQGKGYGRAAMNALIEHIKNNYDNEEIFVAFVPGNETAMNLYKSIGFEDTGRIEEGEHVYQLKIKK